MLSQLQEALNLRHERAGLLAAARALDEKAKSENGRSFTALEQTQFNALMDDYDKKGARVKEIEDSIEGDKKRNERLAAADREQRTLAHEPTHRPGGPSKPSEQEERDAADRTAIRQLIMGERSAPVHLRTTANNLAGDNIQGGYTMPLPKFMAELLGDVDNFTFMEKYCRVIPVADETPLHWPRRDTRLSGARRGGEGTAPTQATGPAFAQRALKPTLLQAEYIASNVWLRSSLIPAEELVRKELAYEFAIGSEQDYLTGSGSELEPLGIFTASDLGVPTSRDYSTNNTATAVTADGLWGAFYQVKPQYRGNLITIGSRPLALQARTLKNGDGTYIWAPGINAQAPDTMFGRPFFESEYCPQTFTTGLYVAAIFDPSQYVIVRKPELEIQRLVEDRARQNQTVILARMWNDGMPVTAEAFVRVKLG